MSGETSYPLTVDTVYGTYSEYRNTPDDRDIVGDGSNHDFAEWMTRVETATVALEYYGSQTLTNTGGVSTVSNTSTETALLANAIHIPANFIQQAGSVLKIVAAGFVTINNTTSTNFTLKTYAGSTSLYTPNPMPTGGANWTLSSTPHLWGMELAVSFDTVGATASVTTIGQIHIGLNTAGTWDFDSTNGSQWRVEGYGGATVDTTSAIDIQIKGTMSVANAGNLMACQRCTATYLPNPTIPA